MDNNLHRPSVTPSDLTFRLIEEITKGFSDEQKVGRGGYGEVYKGVHNGQEIAVKKLYQMPGLNDEEFENEFRNLMMVQHQNIVRLVGYCYEIRHKHVEHNGKLTFAQVIERVLCFEYLQLGSLDKHIYDEFSGPDWNTRYKIIKGTCEGLNYLHNGQKEPIYHLDLKPANILLDKNMIPKIADFGLSRLFASTKTHITNTIKGTFGYLPPEFIQKREISKKFDVFSLGVIIMQIMAGPTGHSKSCEMSSQQFVEHVHENWNRRVQAASTKTSHEIDSLGVKRCIEIASRCVEADRAKRPTIKEIVDELNELDAVTEKMSQLSLESTKGPTTSIGQIKDLGIDPALELRFPFKLNSEISCCLQLTNNTDNFVAFNLKTNQKKYYTHPNKGTIPPWSKCYIIVTMQPQEKPPPNLQCYDMFLVQSTRVSEDLTSDDIAEDLFKTITGKVVDEARLPIVYVALPQPR